MSLSPTQRRQRIADLLADEVIHTQEELQQRLEAVGIVTTQATLSRDLRAMGVAKSPAGYVVPQLVGAFPGAGGDVATRPALTDPTDAMERTLRNELLSAQIAATLVVLRTRPGHANALAVDLDRARIPEVVGTIAGDDTVFLATAGPREARHVAERLRTIAGLQ